MRMRQYDSLRSFTIIARHDNLASAAEELCLTKGAVSHQIRRLEEELGFQVFDRDSRGIRLSPKGTELLATARRLFDDVEDKVDEIRGGEQRTLTIGVTTYFASRWLSPRLMDFMTSHPDIRLRIQPMVDLLNLRGEGVNLAIRWGDGRWTDHIIEKLFPCPAWPTGNMDVMEHVKNEGLEAALAGSTLLRDREDSVAWDDWYRVAGLPHRRRADTLIIPDPNVRVQAVLDGQGVALNDALVDQEIRDGKLFRLSSFELSDYGYFLAYEPAVTRNADVNAFISWLKSNTTANDR